MSAPHLPLGNPPVDISRPRSALDQLIARQNTRSTGAIPAKPNLSPAPPQHADPAPTPLPAEPAPAPPALPRPTAAATSPVRSAPPPSFQPSHERRTSQPAGSVDGRSVMSGVAPTLAGTVSTKKTTSTGNSSALRMPSYAPPLPALYSPPAGSDEGDESTGFLRSTANPAVPEMFEMMPAGYEVPTPPTTTDMTKLKGGAHIPGGSVSSRGALLYGNGDDDNVSLAALPEESRSQQLSNEGGDAEDVYEDNVAPPPVLRLPASVRASVPSGDDITMPVNTLRVWLLGLMAANGFAVLFCSFFNWGWNTRLITSAVIAQIFCWPTGMLMALIPYPAHWPLAWFINPGPFNIKEHALICIMALMGPGPAWPVELMWMHQTGKLGVPATYGYRLLIGLSPTFMALGLVGMAYRALVIPGRMVWPRVLETSALLGALHRTNETNWSRRAVFWGVFGCAFIWAWVPGYLMTCFAQFSWIAWCAKKNFAVNLLFGGSGGMALSFLAFDWSAITAALESPLVVPFWAQVNTLSGYLLFICVIGGALYCSGAQQGWYQPWVLFFPMDRFANFYNYTLIAPPTQKNQLIKLDEVAYESYSKPYFTSSLAVSYGCGLALPVATVVHFVLFDAWQLLQDLRMPPEENTDAHAQSTLRYPQIPHYWWVVIFLIGFAFGIGAVRGYDTDFPVWGFIVALLSAVFFVIPTGVTMGLSAIEAIPINFFQLIAGYMFPGKALAWLLFRLYSITVLDQTLVMLSQFKLGLYFKLPPVLVFVAIAMVELTTSFVQAAMPPVFGDSLGYNWQASLQKAVTWGVLGAKPTFGLDADSTYRWLNWFFLAGLLVPIPAYVLHRFVPMRMSVLGFSWNLIHWPLMFSSAQTLPGWLPISFTSWFVMGAIFQFSLRRKYQNWWTSFNYLTSAALTTATAIAYFLISVGPAHVGESFSGPVKKLNWAPNNIEFETRQGHYDLNFGAAALWHKNITQLAPPEHYGAWAPAPNGQWLPQPGST